MAGTGPHGAVTLGTSSRGGRGSRSQRPAADRAPAMRAAIGAAMGRSKREIPHYYLGDAIPLAAALTWLAARNEERSVTERVLMAALQLKAVALAPQKFPELNGL